MLLLQYDPLIYFFWKIFCIDLQQCSKNEIPFNHKEYHKRFFVRGIFFGDHSTTFFASPLHQSPGFIFSQECKRWINQY